MLIYSVSYILLSFIYLLSFFFYFRQYDRILADESVPEKGEATLGALTAGERTPWAEARTKFFSKGINSASLRDIGMKIRILWHKKKSFHAIKMLTNVKVSYI